MLILASSSPRRYDILKRITDDFIVDPCTLLEKPNENLNMEEIVIDLAMKKALDVFKRHPSSLVLGADTIVYFNGKIYGKPKDYNDAYRMLNELSGNTHYVLTGVCFVKNNKCDTFCGVSKVTFKVLSPDIIKKYLDKKEYVDKAGGYAIQGYGSSLVLKYEGEFDNIVGLPFSIVKDYLSKE